MDFATPDSLDLACHAALRRAPARAPRDAIARLQTRLAAFVGLDAVALGLDQGCVLRRLVGPGDHLLIDGRAGPCLRLAAAATGATLHFAAQHPMADTALGLADLRRTMPRARIMVLGQSLFAADATQPDLAGLQAMACVQAAVFCLDISHDLGAMGPTGGGRVEASGLLGKIDLVTARLGPVFGSSGAFAATSRLPLLPALTAPSALPRRRDAARALAALHIVTGAEGAARRARLMTNVLDLRMGLALLGLAVPGRAGPVVPLTLGRRAGGPVPGLRTGLLAGRLRAQGFGLDDCDGDPSGPLLIHLRADHAAADIARLLSALAKAVSGSGSAYVVNGI